MPAITVLASVLFWAIAHIIKNIYKSWFTSLPSLPGNDCASVPGWLVVSLVDNVLNTGFKASALMWVLVVMTLSSTIIEKGEPLLDQCSQVLVAD